MPIANPITYLNSIVAELSKHWPDSRTINLVFHGHSVPAGYTATPLVNTFHAYPHLLHAALKERFPFAVINAIVTAKGGEHAADGAERFVREVLTHRPDVLMLDYGLNDRGIGLAKAEAGWRQMLEQALALPTKVILLTPTWDNSGIGSPASAEWEQLQAHTALIRRLAEEYEVGLADSFAAFQAYVDAGGNATDLLSWSNHPNRLGHELAAKTLLRWFAYYRQP